MLVWEEMDEGKLKAKRRAVANKARKSQTKVEWVRQVEENETRDKRIKKQRRTATYSIEPEVRSPKESLGDQWVAWS